jgi:multiple sugar transport system substrate-binding protein
LITRRGALVGLAGAALGAAACSARRSERTLVRFWAAGREGEMAAELVADFAHERPDIEVEVQKMPFTAAHEKLLTAYAGDTLPDLCQLGNTWVP